MPQDRSHLLVVGAAKHKLAVVESLLGEKCQGLLGDLEDTLALKLAYRHALLGKEAIFGCVLAQLEHGRILEIWFFSHKCFINVFV